MSAYRFFAGPLVCACTAVLALVAASAQVPQTAQTPQTPVFRGRTTVVPIDVRVLDRRGKPVTDLKAEDFTIFENGVRQTLEYFSTQALTPAEPDPEATVRPTTAPSTTLAPKNRRLFLIYLGRGRLQEPSKGLDATLRFVRERLMPQDQVAVMAWNRATDFTTDKAKVAAVIERFRTAHERIDMELRLHFTGLFGLYGGTEVPKFIQTLIDDVFDPSTGAASRTVVPGDTLDRAEADARRATESVMNLTTFEAFRMFRPGDARMADGMFDPSLNMSFDDYIVLNRQTMQDVGNLYAGIDYLRFIDGEKHLIFVTEQGFYLPRAEHDRDLASLASDARVALDTIQTGGVAAFQDAAGIVSVSNGLQLRALREISDISGGQSSVSNKADVAFDRILSSTEFGYLLGYSPVKPGADGRNRQIKVQVNRPGVTVAHRRSYLARPDTPRFDPRESLASTRLITAIRYPEDVNDLKFSTRLADLEEGGVRYVNVELTIDTSRIRFARADDRYLVAMNFAVLCQDFNGNSLGQLWERKDVFVPALRLDDIRQNGLPVTLRVPVRQRPVYFKIVVYDYGSDLIGSVTKRR